MCETLEPFSECGFGTCVNGSCVCDPGVVENRGFLYRDVPPGVVAYCDYIPLVMYFLAGIVLVLSASGLVMQTRAIRNKRQFKRMLPLLIGYTLLTVSSLYRIILIDDDLFGYDPAYTFMLANSIFLLTCQFVIYTNKYVDYLLRLFYLNERTRNFAKGMLRFSYLCFFLFAVGENMLFVAVFVESRADQLTLVQLGTSIYAFLFSYYLLAGVFLFTAYINDLKTVIKSDEAPERSGTMHSSTFADRCRKMLPRIVRVRAIFFIATSLTLFLNASAALSEGWLKMMMWLVWGMMTVYSLCSMYVLIIGTRTRELKERFRSANPSFRSSWSVFDFWRKRSNSKGSDSYTAPISITPV